MKQKITKKKKLLAFALFVGVFSITLASCFIFDSSKKINYEDSYCSPGSFEFNEFMKIIGYKVDNSKEGAPGSFYFYDHVDTEYAQALCKYYMKNR